MTLEQIVARIEDPETPLVWLDPSTPEEYWRALPETLKQAGFRVIRLDAEGDIVDHNALLDRFAALATLPEYFRHDLNSLKDCLLGLPDDCEKGWAVLFRNPEPLRQNDEATFEDLLEILNLVHESKFELHMKVFKLVVTD
jgi:RNAse (barnase) inhibitor barstar